MKEIKDSWVFYTKDDPDFKFDSKYTRTIPTVDKDETFIMETTLEKPDVMHLYIFLILR